MAVTWPGKTNGEISLSEMVDVVNYPARSDRDGDYLHPAAAHSLMRLQRDMLRDLGKTIGTEEAFRSRATQNWYAGPDSPLPPGTAVAPPGTSKHGWGRANDITGYNDPEIWAWLQANAWRYGWDWTEGKNSNEKWHWVYIGSLATAGLDWTIFDPPKSKKSTAVVNRRRR